MHACKCAGVLLCTCVRVCHVLIACGLIACVLFCVFVSPGPDGSPDSAFGALGDVDRSESLVSPSQRLSTAGSMSSSQLLSPGANVGQWQERVLSTDLWLRQADIMGQLQSGVRNKDQWEEWCGFVAPLVPQPTSPNASRVLSPSRHSVVAE